MANNHGPAVRPGRHAWKLATCSPDACSDWPHGPCNVLLDRSGTVPVARSILRKLVISRNKKIRILCVRWPTMNVITAWVQQMSAVRAATAATKSCAGSRLWAVSDCATMVLSHRCCVASEVGHEPILRDAAIKTNVCFAMDVYGPQR